MLVHHQDKYTAKQAAAMATCIHSGYIDEVVSESVNPGCCNTEITKPAKKTINTSKITKDISDILNIPEISDSAHLILIEGAPGIGKTSLLHEIAYQWAKGQLLQT